MAAKPVKLGRSADGLIRRPSIASSLLHISIHCCSMKPNTNILVIGAGQFGINYARILARLNSRQFPEVPRIDQLILTRTTNQGAVDVVDQIREEVTVSAGAIIPEKVSNTGDLRRLLKQYHPDVTAIVARDKKAGDKVHSRYAALALAYGAVLSEKPFYPAIGDGASLKVLKILADQNYSHPLGLELPMAVVGQQLWQIPTLRRAIENASRIRFHWEAAVRSAVSLVDDLVLHPWSLLPPIYRIIVQGISETREQADIQLLLFHRTQGHQIPCSIKLVKGGRMRWMAIDDITLTFQSQGRWMRVMQTDQPFNSRGSTQDRLDAGHEILAVDNPLEQHIVAMLRRRPLIGFEQITRTQRLLEQLHGYVLDIK